MRKIFAAMLIALTAAACTTNEDDDFNYEDELLQVGTEAPDMTIYPEEYPEGLTLSSLRGERVLIEFWRSTCPDCRNITQQMKGFYSKYAPEGLVMVGVSFDTDAQKWQAYITENNLEWMQHCELKSTSSSPIGTTYNIRWVPTLYLIAPDGTIEYGTIYADRMAAKLAETYGK